ncbi:MAG: hypothetical protein GY941_16480 [Planctomycetes bacterium]|nr:hypothetical protein [Planctomycetota bacterium]
MAAKKTMRLKFSTIVTRYSISVVLLVSILIPGCFESKPPQAIARSFWDAVQAKNDDTAHKYATTSSYATIDLLEERFNVTSVTLGKILIDVDKTTIETTIHMITNGSKETVPLQTILVKEKGLWKVDYVKTKATFSIHFSFTEMLNNIQRFGNKFSEYIEKSLEDLKQNMPEIEKEMTELGTTVSERLKEAWDQYLPEIKKNVAEFSKALENALKNGSIGPKEDPPQKKESPP